ncbi:sarcalumenin-like [Argiope bruennichi]|uniref:Sarcalumenin like protein n=1 Tax=Argiope bruennichi TaxID=94029 RepID=A0A8T0EZH6_ARGBR|nr:sarcalumenin-like [Argiope bruennichi]KAF8784264.1 Sarcalumenin like protein [Argiope bruennichi]
MSLCKWSCICFLGGLILIGWPATVSCESSSEDKHPPGVKECRVHIEKALEQYWDKKEPEEISNPTEENHSNYLDESNSNEEEKDSRIEQKDSSNLERPNYNKDPNDEENNNDKEEIDDNEDNTDDVETEDNDEDDDDAEDEDSEKDTNDDDDGNIQDTENINDNAEEEEADEEEEAENDNEYEDKESKSEDEVNNNEDEDDDENEEKSEDRNDDEQDSDEIEPTASSRSSQASAYDNEDDTDLHENDENDGIETNSKEETTENEEGDVDLDESKEDEENDETDDENDEDDGEESENSEDGKEEEKEIEKSSLDESAKKESDTIPEEHTAENGKDIEKAPEEETPPMEETEGTSDAESEPEEEEDDSIENIYEEEEEPELHSFRSREHIDVILGIDEIGTGLEKEEEKLAQSVFRDIKKIETTHIKPVELLYKYADSTTRVLGDAEIFSKPMLLFLGPWGAGKTSIINYLLGLERTPSALKIGSTGITDVDFTLLTYGAQRRIVSGTELAADWKYVGVQKFGQGFLDHFRSIHIPHPLLQKVTILDSPGIAENRKNTERGYALNAAFQWFIDRADAIYVVLDPSKVDIGGELGSVIEQLQGQNVRFLLNKADSIRRSDLMRVVGQLFWNLSPLLGGAEAPLIYAVSLTSHPYHPSAPAKFLADQEKNFLYDIKSTLEKRVENKILYARKHAVRVRNHAKMVDCYLASYYRHKSIFSNKRNVAKLITENPKEYNIYDGLTSMTNVSRSDIPNPLAYKEFFKIHPLYDFKPLASTCSYFRGCPMDKVDLAITKEFPELLAKYKEAKRALYGQLEQDR